MITIAKKPMDLAMPRLSVLVPTPLYGGSLPIAYHAAEAFQELGHSCQVLKCDQHYESYKILAETVSGASGQRFQGRLAELLADYIAEAAIEQRVDLVWYTAQSPVSIPALKRLREAGIKSTLWFVEDVRRFEYWKYLAAEFDIVFTIQTGASAAAIRRAGAKKVVYLPLAANPRIHYPRNLSHDELERYQAEVSFVGAGYPNRVALFERLNLPLLKLWGNDWPKEWKQRLQDGGRRVSTEETARIYIASSVNLNIHSFVGPSSFDAGDFVNPRTFEIAACRGFQIVNHQSPLNDLFTESEIASVHTEQELAVAIKRYRENVREREQMSHAGFLRVRKVHTYAHRIAAAVKEILKTTAASYSRPMGMTIADLKTAAWGDVEMQAFLSRFKDDEPATLARLVEKVSPANSELSRAELIILMMQEFRNWGVEKGVIQ